MSVVTTICGLDEAGRGPLAGPLVAAAVVLPKDFTFGKVMPDLRLNDSKKMNEKLREAAVPAIQQHALRVETAMIDVDDINEKGIGWANKAIFCRLIELVAADLYVVDGNLNLEYELSAARWQRTQVLVQADTQVLAVMAASVIAKTTRDAYMRKLHLLYPDYHWLNNKGYGTRQHVEAIWQFGVTPYHRQQFVRTALAKFEDRG
jgi:ribonuclease HII